MDRVLSTIGIPCAVIKNTVLNRLVGYYLVKPKGLEAAPNPESMIGYPRDLSNNRPRTNAGTRREEAFAKNLFPETDCVDYRMLNRFAAGMFVLVTRNDVAFNAKTDVVKAAEDMCPEMRTSPGGRLSEKIDFIATDLLGQGEEDLNRAVDVFLAFFGHKRSDGVRPSYGKSFLEFREAVKGYYLTQDRYINIIALPHCFEKYKPPSTKAVSQKLTKDKFSVFDTHKNPFDAQLSLLE